ncbi:hypothetical protein LSTR_LSTR012785 [Laodelphax striatellus]|uniref:Calponin-homology (CH) domain-containing protein n=1 Tax=Laodelphax striatellus TaxID=195883 RepID=A0A482WIC3_LAOST|nr:hypothetical protein LSTR_LSTR012785 [Laodelphax striatellus]
MKRSSQVGLVARSPEGHAAHGMQIKGHETSWVEIQAHTFRNWVNEHLRSVGLEVLDLTKDFQDGTKLCALLEVLQGRQIKPPWIRKPANQHQCLENAASALKAIAEDGIKLVNIGNVDIINGNLKLILGLIWSLIVRYQIGRSKFPPRKLMLAWLKAVLPECRVANFTTDWNSGIHLSALLDYCEPGLMSHWRHLDPHDRSVPYYESSIKLIVIQVNQVDLARSRFNIPMVLEPEYLASPFLDELSGMTYLSYFMKENSPGFKSTLRWVNSQLPDKHISNFTTDWNDGSVLCSLVNSLGASAKCHPSSDPLVWESNLNAGEWYNRSPEAGSITGGRKLGVEPILRAKDMADANVEHLGVMAYAANFQWIPPRTSPSLTVAVSCDAHTTRIHVPTNFKIDFLSDDVDPRAVTAEVLGPEGERIKCQLTLGANGGRGTFTAMHVGMHQVSVLNKKKVNDNGYDRRNLCAVGSIVEVLVNSNGARSGLIEVVATSPTGRQLDCPVREQDGVYTATFQPDEPGEWSIAVRHSGELIQGGPFTCFVFDPNGVKLLGIESPAIPESIFNFDIDARGTGGLGQIVVDIVQDRHSLPHTIERIGDALYHVSLHTHRPGKYRIYVYFNGNPVKGSPFPLRVGTREQIKAERLSEKYSSERHTERVISNNYHNRVTSPLFERVSSPVNQQHRYTTTRVHSPVNSPLHSPSPHSPLRSPVYRHSPVNGHYRVPSPSSPLGFHNNSHTSIDTSSNVRVSSMLSNLSQRRDSWDAIVKTQKSVDEIDAEVTGDALHLIPIRRSASFYINSDAPLSQVTVTVTSPSKISLPVKLTKTGKQILVYFTASEIGEHVIDIKINDMRVHGAPFRSHAYNANAIKVDRIPNGVVGQAVEFEIDGSGAGSGNLEILVNGGHVTSFVRNLGSQRFLASFVPHEAVTHLVEMKFNGDSIPADGKEQIGLEGWRRSGGGGRRRRRRRAIEDGNKEKEEEKMDDEEMGKTVKEEGEEMEEKINEEQKIGKIVKASGPSKRPVSSQVLSEPGGVYRVEFTPTEVGSHLVDVTVAGDKLPAGPLVAKVYNSALIRVTDVASGVVGQPCQFRVETSQAGPGNLEVTVNGGRVPTSAQAQGQHTYAISFMPRQALPHTVDLRFNGQDVPGSPFTCAVSDAARVVLSGCEDKVSVDKPAIFVVECEPSLGSPHVQVLSPTRNALPVSVKPLDTPGRFSSQFTPRDVGDHSVEVKLGGAHVEGSPFLVKAYDATKVKVTDINSNCWQACLLRNITVAKRVNASQAGAGNLEIIVSVNGCNVPNYVQSEGNAKFRVNFKPREAAPHNLSVRFNGEPIPGSPFTCRVLEPGQVAISGSGIKMTGAGRPAYVYVDCAGAAIDVQATSPANRKLPVKITHPDAGNRVVAEFTPQEVGRTMVTVEADGQPVKGSPFTCNVYNVQNIKVTGLGPAKVGKPVTFSVDATEAGEGTLELVISTEQSTVKAEVVACSRGLYDVTFVPHQLTPHFVSISFNDEDLPGSPLRCEVLELPGKKSTATARGEGLNQVVLGAVAYFEINPHTSEPGSIDAQIIGPDGSRVPVTIDKLETGLFRAKYRPACVGTHSITILQRRQPITKQPFAVQVFDPLQVKLTDLSEAFCHRAATFKVDTRGAGSGALSVNIRAAGSEVKHTLRELETAGLYQVVYHPQVAIPHRILIKYNNMSIAGCPMEVQVTDPGVGRDVTATGLGLYQSRSLQTLLFTSSLLSLNR